MRTIALEEAEDWRGMLEWCQKWTKSEPENADAWFGLAIAYDELNRYNDAAYAFRQAIRINPEYADAWYNLAIAYALSGNRGAALEAVKELRRLDPVRADRLFDLIMPR